MARFVAILLTRVGHRRSSGQHGRPDFRLLAGVGTADHSRTVRRLCIATLKANWQNVPFAGEYLSELSMGHSDSVVPVYSQLNRGSMTQFALPAKVRIFENHQHSTAMPYQGLPDAYQAENSSGEFAAWIGQVLSKPENECNKGGLDR